MNASIRMVKSELDRIVAMLSDRFSDFVPRRLAIIRVHQLVEVLFGSSEAVLLETEYLFKLVAPGNSVRREIKLPDAHATALHGQCQHRLVMMYGFLDPLALVNIEDDLRGADNHSHRFFYLLNEQSTNDITTATTHAYRIH